MNDEKLKLYEVVPPEHEGDWLPVLTRDSDACEDSINYDEIYRDRWQCRLKKTGRLGSPLVEVTPFVFKNKLYRLENWQKFWEIGPAAVGERYLEDEVRIRDVETETIVSVPLKGCSFAAAFVYDNKVYVFAGNHNTASKWRKITDICMTYSDDLVNWSEPKTVIKALPGEYVFNVAVCRGKDSFVLLYETDDSAWPKFTFRYCVSEDLFDWELIPEAIYGKEKYVGGPALYYEGNYYYTLYVESIAEGWETRITRSQDLIHWKDAPDGRAFLTYDPLHKNMPLCKPEVSECNASDAELCYWKGKTIVYFTGGDQLIAGDLQAAEFDGTPKELLEHYFEEPQVAVPSTRQLAYQNDQLGAFVHFGPATYTQKSDFMSVPDVSLFNPAQLDAEQWVLAAKSFGAKYIVLTTKHHNGYCLWSTKTTDYGVANGPWKNGKGDVVREFVDAARKHGIKPGIYFSLGDMHEGCHSNRGSKGKRDLIGDRSKLFKLIEAQLGELLSNYGSLSLVWFDGAYDPFGTNVVDSQGKLLGVDGGDKIVKFIRSLQPEILIFGGTRPEVRWSGSERGWAEYPLINVIHKGTAWIPPYMEGWCPVEANLHTRDTWFWASESDDTLLSVDELMEKYFKSIGRGANLLVNMTPDTRGLIPDVEVERLNKFGEEIEKRLGTPIASVSSEGRWSEGNTLELNFDSSRYVEYLIIEENIKKGQKVLEYLIEVYSGGKWKPISRGLTVGRKRIEILEAVQIQRIRLRVLKSVPCPEISLFAAFGQ